MDYLSESLRILGNNKQRNSYKLARAVKLRGDNHIFNTLCGYYIGRFKWRVPEGEEICPKLIEQTLLFDGRAGFYKAENGKWRLAKVVGENYNTYYGEAATCQLFNYSGKAIGTFMPKNSIPDTLGNCVIMYDNDRRLAPIVTILFYADRLSKISTAIDGCVSNVTGTSIITGTAEQVKAIQKQEEAKRVGIPTIIAIDDMDISARRPELLSSPTIGDQLKLLYEAYDKTLANYLQTIGIRTNARADKFSGVTPLEVIEGRQNVDLVINQALGIRREACEKLSEMGLTITPTLDNFKNELGDYLDTGAKVGGYGGLNDRKEEGNVLQ